MIKNGVLIQQDNKCFLCGKKGFKEIKDDVNETLYEIREKRDNIDESLNFDVITE